MAINRGSLYATFGNKRGVFLAAVDRYERVVAQDLLDTLRAPGSGTEAIRRFFRAKVSDAGRSGRPKGCLLTNTAIERAVRDPAAAARVGAALARMEAAFLGALQRARAAGEISGRRDLRALARFFTNTAQGLSVLSRAGAPRAMKDDVAIVALSLLRA
jgi:TetR/AcrR family transcriptional repressor of nem operon